MVPISSLPSKTAAGTISIDSAVIHQTPRGHSHGRPMSIRWALSCGAGLLERGRAHRPSSPRIETAVVAGTALCRAYHGGSGHWPWQKQSCALARAVHCPSPSPQGLDGHSTPESDKYKKTVPLVLTLTHPDLILKPLHSLSLQTQVSCPSTLLSQPISLVTTAVCQCASPSPRAWASVS